MMANGDFGWHGLGMGLWGILFWVVLIVVVVVVVRALMPGRKDGKPTGDRALQVLRERYARGEIDKEEFERKKHDLGE
jgi:putative membrane protein